MDTPDLETLDPIFSWDDEDENHVYEWGLFLDSTLGIPYQVSSIYCPCCGGPKGEPTPIWDLNSWTKPHWATPSQGDLFQVEVIKLFEGLGS